MLRKLALIGAMLSAVVLMSMCDDSKDNGNNNNCQCHEAYHSQNGMYACEGSEDYSMTEEQAKQQCQVCEPAGCTVGEGEGEGDLPAEGEGELPAEGEGELPAEGEGELPF